MPTESSLTRDEKASLAIQRFIFHIIVKGQDEPQYLDEVRLDTNERGFFRDRIVDATEGTQFVFVPDSDGTSPIVAHLARQIVEEGADFVELSKAIAREFLRWHKGNTSDGVFLISIVSVMRNGAVCQLLSLVKVDHTRVLQFETEGTTAFLKELANTFVEDKAAIQKMALVDPSQTYAWDVLGSERGTAEDMAEYFKKFLGVAPRENERVLTKRAVSTVRVWFRTLPQAEIPEGENVTSYKGRAVSYMETHDRFDTDAFVDTVVLDAVDPERKAAMVSSLRERLAQAGIAGQSFTPVPDALRIVKRSKAKTSRNVRIMWEGDPSDRGITIPTVPDAQGRYCIEVISDHRPILE